MTTIQVIRITTTNDPNGNPRRGWDVFDGTRHIGFVDEGYRGSRALLADLHLNNHSQYVQLMEYKVPPIVYVAKKRGPQVHRTAEWLDMGRPIRWNESRAGALIDSHHGRYISSMVVRMAHDYGMLYSSDDTRILHAYANGREEITLGTGRDAEKVDVFGLVLDQGGMRDLAEEWLTEHIAPEGYYFGSDPDSGDFGLWPIVGDD